MQSSLRELWKAALGAVVLCRRPLPPQHSHKWGMAQGSMVAVDIAPPFQPGIVERPGSCEQKQLSKTVEEYRSLLKQ